MERVRALINPADLPEGDRNNYFQHFRGVSVYEDGHPRVYRGSQPLIDFVLDGTVGIGVVVRLYGQGIGEPVYALTPKGWKKMGGDEDRAFTPEEMLDIPDHYPDLMIPWQFGNHQFFQDTPAES